MHLTNKKKIKCYNIYTRLYYHLTNKRYRQEIITYIQINTIKNDEIILYLYIIYVCTHII